MFSDPVSNLAKLGLTEGQKVVDLGAGSGFYSIPAARAVGENGKVYAVEVQKELLSKLKNEALKSRFLNVEVIWGNIEKLGGTKIHERSVDAVIVSNVLFQVENKTSFLDEVDRILKPNGRVLVVDWTGSSVGLGPKNSSIISSDNAKKIFQDKGFIFEKDINAGTNHYGFIVIKK